MCGDCVDVGNIGDVLCGCKCVLVSDDSTITGTELGTRGTLKCISFLWNFSEMGFIAGNSSKAILVVCRSSMVRVQGRVTFSLLASAIITRTRRMIPSWLGKISTTCASGF